jgi:broad specificity phosphatase PhoE
VPPTDDPDRLRRAHAVLIRHGETTYNATHQLNGDPAVDVSLSPHGREQCRALVGLLGPIPWTAVHVTRFRRTAQSAEIIVPGRPPEVLADLDDIDVGAFEGLHRDEYRAWRRRFGVDVAPEGGESRLTVARRYGRGLAALAAGDGAPVLVITHDQPIRYTENALLGEDPIVGPAPPVPNAQPFAYGREELRRAAEVLHRYEPPAAERGRRPAS